MQIMCILPDTIVRKIRQCHNALTISLEESVSNSVTKLDIRSTNREGWKTENKREPNQHIPVGWKDKTSQPELHSATTGLSIYKLFQKDGKTRRIKSENQDNISGKPQNLHQEGEQSFSSPLEWEQNIPNCQIGNKHTLTARTLENIKSFSPPDQHKRETHRVAPQGWKLEKVITPENTSVTILYYSKMLDLFSLIIINHSWMDWRWNSATRLDGWVEDETLPSGWMLDFRLIFTDYLFFTVGSKI